MIKLGGPDIDEHMRADTASSDDNCFQISVLPLPKKEFANLLF
jgi:hypothetical protein